MKKEIIDIMGLTIMGGFVLFILAMLVKILVDDLKNN